jgi:predicted RecA/RadA family phage recombinase
MKNYVQPGDVLNLTAPAGGLLSGQAYLFGSLFGVATKAAAEGERVAVSVEGVFTLPKASGISLTEGVKVYWTGTAITTTASGNTLVGNAAAVAAADATTAEVRIQN